MQIKRASELKQQISDEGTLTIYVSEDLAIRISPIESFSHVMKLIEIHTTSMGIPSSLIEKVSKKIEYDQKSLIKEDIKREEEKQKKSLTPDEPSDIVTSNNEQEPSFEGWEELMAFIQGYIGNGRQDILSREEIQCLLNREVDFGTIISWLSTQGIDSEIRGDNILISMPS